MDLSRFRKLIALIVSGAVIYVLQLLGLNVNDMAQFGFGLDDISGPIVEYLVLYGIPAVIFAAQPDGDDRRWLLSQWHWLLGGAAVVAVLAVLAVVVL